MHDDADDLTPAERDALASLPREDAPGDLLEERTVRALRAAGLLGPRRRHGLLLTPARAALAAAAVLALVVGSFALGQRSVAGPAGAHDGAGVRARAGAGAEPGFEPGVELAAHPDDAGPLQTAVEVQRAGTAYINALARLGRSATGADSLALRQGREVAIATLIGAAELLRSLDPQRPAAGARPPAAGADSLRIARRDIVWF